MSLSARLLLGRLLTRSGDQAWDFAAPIILLKIMPGELRVAALYFFVARLAVVLFLPSLTGYIDRMNRFSAATVGIVLQLIGVIIGVVSIYWLASDYQTGELWQSSWLIAFGFACLGGILSSLGSSFMDITIANDLVPAAFKPAELSLFNGRLRRVDLFTEVVSPILAGTLLTLSFDSNPLMGFYIVGIWNVISFVPEYFILTSIFSERPDLRSKLTNVPQAATISIVRKFSEGWRSFFREPIALSALAYAILWLSVLSPHGVLLTAYLKDGWNLPEWEIGTFRGMGAFFGIAATFAFPRLERRWGVVASARNFLIFQAVMVTTALVCFHSTNRIGQIGFLVFILFSRFGLYGFSLGETQIRQVGISPENRGKVNGFASALTAVATLGLYGAGALLDSTDSFRFLIYGSVFFVTVGMFVFVWWSTQVDSSSAEAASNAGGDFSHR